MNGEMLTQNVNPVLFLYLGRSIFYHSSFYHSKLGLYVFNGPISNWAQRQNAKG